MISEVMIMEVLAMVHYLKRKKVQALRYKLMYSSDREVMQRLEKGELLAIVRQLH